MTFLTSMQFYELFCALFDLLLLDYDTLADKLGVHYADIADWRCYKGAPNVYLRSYYIEKLDALYKEQRS